MDYEATSRFANFEIFKFTFAIRVYLLYPYASSFFYGFLVSLWCFSTSVNYYFKVSFNLKGQCHATWEVLQKARRCLRTN